MSLEPGLWLIVYDISDDARRRRVHSLLKQYGDPVQGSAFEARLTRAEHGALLERAAKLVDHSKDKLFFYPMVRAREADIVALGLPRPEIRRRTFWII